MTALAVRMPKLGMTMEEGTVVEWRVAVGARVEKGEPLLVIESEKNEAELEATAAGYLRHVYAEPGDVVPCGSLLAALTDEADESFDAEAFAAAEAPAQAKPAARAEPAAAPARRAAAGATGARRPIVPAARALARKLGLDVEKVSGTGPGGRVTREDVEAFAAARERLVEVAPGVGVEVLREGEGEALLLLPGFGSDASSFALLTPHLVRHFAVLAMNPRGVGASDPGGEDALDPARLASDAAAVIERAAGGPAHVVGASLGAAVAIELALTRPELVRSLSLITPFVTATPRLLAVVEAWQRIAAEASPATLARFLAPLLFSEALLADDARRERTLRGLAAAAARTPAATLARTAAGLTAWSGTREKDLARIACPTLVIAAADDLLTPDAESAARAIPGARCIVVREAGHAVAIEAADAVAEALAMRLGEAPG